MTPVDKAWALIEMAHDASATNEERRSAAMRAVEIIKKYELRVSYGLPMPVVNSTTRPEPVEVRSRPAQKKDCHDVLVREYETTSDGFRIDTMTGRYYIGAASVLKITRKGDCGTKAGDGVKWDTCIFTVTDEWYQASGIGD